MQITTRIRAGGLACLLVVCAGSALAQGNIYRAGGDVNVGKPVDGDFVAAGGKVTIDQPVSGDVSVAGGSVEVRAAVGDDLRAAGGEVIVDAAVQGELLAAGGTVTLTRQAVVQHGARIYTGELVMDGRIEGPLRAGAEKITINGEVRGDARLKGDQIELGPNAKITGALTYTSANPLKKADGATIGGAVRQEARRGGERAAGEPRPHRRTYAGAIVFFLGLLACGALLLLVFPRFAADGAQRVGTDPLGVLGIGLLALVAVPVLAVLLFITLLGIPLGLAVLALYPVLLLAGFLLGTLFIARLLPRALKREAPAAYAPLMGYFAAALLAVVLAVRLPYAGGFVLLLVGLAGLGALVLELQHRIWPGRARAG